MMMDNGGGGGEYFSLHRSLQSDINKSISTLEELFHQTFRQITYFQGKLENQSGKAATTLRENLNDHAEMMSTSASSFLNFGDILSSLMLAIEATDEGNIVLVSPRGRMEWKYSLSMERIEEEINLDSQSLRQAANKFETNLVHMQELFYTFNKMIHKGTDGSHLPWGDLRAIWTEAAYEVKSIAEELKNQMEALIKDTNTFVSEMSRVDHMAGHAMLGIYGRKSNVLRGSRVR
jgi:ElaB/YqjD/DUF883 family membrane-anchored ribosome-binding protein